MTAAAVNIPPYLRIAEAGTIRIGIDPDCSKSGVAILGPGKELTLRTLPFFPLQEWLLLLRDQVREVVVEAGWLNAISNYHGTAGRVGANMAKKVGANHETGRKIVEMCEHIGIPVRLQKPLKKMWKGREGKITAEEFARVTGYTGSTNQETRDAALLIWR